MMKIYLAHNFIARSWLPEVVSKLEKAGHTCTSRWIFDDAHSKTGNLLDSAVVDLEDIDNSDCLVLFVDQFGATPGKGKYFELGYAYATGKRVILVGQDARCVFYALPNFEKVENLEELYVKLG